MVKIETKSPFLELVARDLILRFGEELNGVTVVFPNRRASLFFTKHIAELITKPIWLPTTLTINEILIGLSGLTPEDPIRMVFKLHRIYQTIIGESIPIENFYFWGEVILADFDQVDRYLVDANQLYSNIKDLKEIESRFGGLTPEQTQALHEYLGVMDTQESSDLKANYLKVWNILGPIYHQLKKELEAGQLCFEGMGYRIAASKLKEDASGSTLPSRIAFIGFNALNPCEAELFNFYKKSGNGLFYWDCHPEFISNTDHEAGHYMRSNLARYGNSLPTDPSVEGSPYPIEITVLAAPSEVAQTKLLPRILETLKNDGAVINETTAIVLPKENILLPTIQSLPSNLEGINITMGYPVRETPAYNLAESLIRLQMNAREGKDSNTLFYHRDAIAVLNHPYIRFCEPIQTSSIAQRIKSENRIYPSSQLLATAPLLSSIFTRIEPESLSGYLIAICSEVALSISQQSQANNEDQNMVIDLEFLYSLHKCLTRLNDVVSSSADVPHRIYLQLLRRVIAQERVSFTGEPLSGLQVMGFLETRALDFENLIVLSFNDDVIPGKNHPVSFITPSLRVAFGLPDYRHHDSVHSHIFYRLLPRAKRVFLVYSSRSEGLSSGERSRFAMQLELEQMVGKVNHIPVGYKPGMTPSQPISIEKSNEVMEALLSGIRKDEGYTLSPSAITTYLTCPLRFYFRYCLKLDEEDEVAEEIGAMEFGNIIHRTMQELYMDLANSTVQRDDIDRILSSSTLIDQTISIAFSEEFLKQSAPTSPIELSGRNTLALNAIKYTIRGMLRVDLERTPFHLLSHEEKIFMPLTSVITDNEYLIQLGGIVDRMEKEGDGFVVIDYKTGKADDRKGTFRDIEQLFTPKYIDNNKEVLQTFCYCLALASLHPNAPIRPALWFVRRLKSKDEPKVEIKEGRKSRTITDFNEFSLEFKERLDALVAEIFDPNHNFDQTEHTKHCEYCPFGEICVRE